MEIGRVSENYVFRWNSGTSYREQGSRVLDFPDLTPNGFLRHLSQRAEGLFPTVPQGASEKWGKADFSFPENGFYEGDISGMFQKSFLNSYPFHLKMGSK